MHLFSKIIIEFLEREENVKCDIFLAYRALLKITKPVARSAQSTDAMETTNRLIGFIRILI